MENANPSTGMTHAYIISTRGLKIKHVISWTKQWKWSFYTRTCKSVFMWWVLCALLEAFFEQGTQYIKNLPAFQPGISSFCSGKENLLQNGNLQRRQRYFIVSKHNIQEYSSSSSSKPPWFAGMLEKYWVQGWFKHSRLIHTLKWLNFDYHWLSLIMCLALLCSHLSCFRFPFQSQRLQEVFLSSKAASWLVKSWSCLLVSAITVHSSVQ